MQLPFTQKQFLEIFRSYNLDVFPLQILFYLIAFFIIYLLFKKSRMNDMIIPTLLSFFWLWIGVVYHIIYFSKINKAAYIFGILFILQGLLFLFYGRNLDFKYRKNIYTFTGIIFILYALVIYPVLGYSFGHQYPSSPTFGLPCPTTIFTFGVLLFAAKKISMMLLIIPLLWSILGFSAALNLGIYEDIGLLLSGVLGFTAFIIHNKKVNYTVKTA